MAKMEIPSIPILDLSWADNPERRPLLLEQLRSALYDVGFLYIKGHDIPSTTINKLTDLLPSLFALPPEEKAKLSKLNSPHFLGYSGFAEETTLGKQDLREQFDLAAELPVVYRRATDSDGSEAQSGERDFSKLYWRLRGPNQWPEVPGFKFKEAFTAYHDALRELSYRFVHLIEEAFGIPVGTFDHFFGRQQASDSTNPNGHTPTANGRKRTFLPPQHRIKLLRYPPSTSSSSSNTPEGGQGVGAHKDSSGWLTFLLQVGHEPGLEVLSPFGTWLKAPPLEGTFVVNFGKAFEAATEGAVKATTHRVISPGPESRVRYSIPFFQGLPLDMAVSEVRDCIPEGVRGMRKNDPGGREGEKIDGFLDPRWDRLGESQLRKWIRSHRDVGVKWYGESVVEYYMA
jgi:isopenicillin N synthase-like dioxygenase